MGIWCKFLVWSVLCSAPWMFFMWSWSLPFKTIDALAWAIPSGGWILLVSIGMRFKGGRDGTNSKRS